MVEVGGRGGASGGRGRLRLRALKGIVSHIQHALLPLDEVRRIYVAFGEHPAAGGWGLKFVGWVVSVLCDGFVCGCVFVSVFVCVCVCVFVLLGVLLVVCV